MTAPLCARCGFLARPVSADYDERMRGDIILDEAHHRRAAGEIAQHLADRIARDGFHIPCIGRGECQVYDLTARQEAE